MKCAEGARSEGSDTKRYDNRRVEPISTVAQSRRGRDSLRRRSENIGFTSGDSGIYDRRDQGAAAQIHGLIADAVRTDRGGWAARGGHAVMVAMRRVAGHRLRSNLWRALHHAHGGERRLQQHGERQQKHDRAATHRVILRFEARPAQRSQSLSPLPEGGARGSVCRICPNQSRNWKSLRDVSLS